MNENSASRPVVCIDLKKNRIRIHRNTLHLLGDPEYIQLLVNPDTMMIAIRKSFSGDHLAHHIYPSLLAANQCYELYSHTLIECLKSVCNKWEANCSYRIYGEFIENHLTALFPMNETSLIKETSEHEERQLPFHNVDKG